ncbi:MAG TPA: polysaccharide deacetylase family protein [Ignavibacteriaceae bacterium]|nr:polysaccharide deacetylase family protein [Ignavibacteriaceae bacterium]
MTKKNSIIIIILLFALSAKGQTIGHVTVKTWPNDMKSAFSFTFDDCFKSQYDYALPVLNSFGFKGTFYVIAEEPTEQGEPLNWRYATWDQFREIAQQGHEIGSHSMTHPHLQTLQTGDINTPNTIYYELYQSKKLIENKIPGIKVITFAYPYTEYNPTVISIAGQYYEASRRGNGIPNNSVITGTDWQKINSYEVQFNLPRDIVNDDNDELNEIENTLQNEVIDNGKWGMLFAHEVLPFSQIPDAVAAGYWYPMSTEWLNAFCQWMKNKSDNNDIWVNTVANVTKYIKERENFVANVVSVTDTLIVLSLTDNLDDTIFNYPLTLDIQVPSVWETVLIKQGGITIPTDSIFVAGNNTYVRTKIIPDAGNISLKKDATTGIAINNNIPIEYKLMQNYPNPFNPSTKIGYIIPFESKVSIKIFNLLGQEIKELQGSTESAGYHEVLFNASNLASGIYFYKIVAISTNGKNIFVDTKKLNFTK